MTYESIGQCCSYCALSAMSFCFMWIECAKIITGGFTGPQFLTSLNLVPRCKGACLCVGSSALEPGISLG